ncbi:MAG: DUF211 domain-containing protein [Candidatus Ranarchaeia archaeon]
MDTDPKTGISRLVLDCLKPHQPSTWEVASTVSKIQGVTSVNVFVDEIDSETESIKITIDGIDLSVPVLEKELKQACVAIHSIDQVIAGKTSSAGNLILGNNND